MNVPIHNHSVQLPQMTDSVPPSTLGQLIFDVTFGIVLPLLCLIFDPIVFINNPYQVFIYLFIWLEMMTLAVWSGWGKYFSNTGLATTAGILWLGAFFSLVVGLLLLPVSIILSLMLIGILGFTPLFTAVVFYRNGRRAVIQARKQMRLRILSLSFLFGMGGIVALPGYAQWYTSQLVSQVVQGVLQDDVQSAMEATRKLKFIPWCLSGCLSEIVTAYYDTEQQPFQQHQQLLAKIYYEITGRELEEVYYAD